MKINLLLGMIGAFILGVVTLSAYHKYGPDTVQTSTQEIKIPMNQAEQVLNKLKTVSDSHLSSITFYTDGSVAISAFVNGVIISSSGKNLTEATDSLKKTSKLLD